MVSDWPSLNSLVWLRLPCCGSEHPSRVEDVDGDNLVIGTPMAPHTMFVTPLDPKQGFFLGWVQGKGALELPVALVSHQNNPMPTWTLKATGKAVETQRRNFVRLDFEMKVHLYLIDRGAPAIATTLNISEGGLRCRLDNWAIDPGPRAFDAELDLDGKNYILRCQCVWWGPLDKNNTRIMGIKFLEIETRISDAIRSFIFAQQLLERRKEKDVA